MSLLLAPAEAHERQFKEIAKAVRSGAWRDDRLLANRLDYFAATEASSPHDCSAVVCDGDTPIAAMKLNLLGEELGAYGRPTSILLAAEIDASTRRSAIKLLLDCALAEAEKAQARFSLSVGLNQDGSYETDATEALSSGAELLARHHAVVDLGQDEAGLRKALRKSYKSLVNWGRRNLETEIVSRENPNRDLFARFEAFHVQVSGRRTRSAESWRAMFEMTALGDAELITGKLDGEICACTYVVHSADHAIYATGVYDRERFELPIAHWPVFLAISRMRERGGKQFDLGEVFLGAEAGPKEQNIAFFKRGFTDRIAPRFTAVFDRRRG